MYGNTFHIDFSPFINSLMRCDNRDDSLNPAVTGRQAAREWATAVVEAEFGHDLESRVDGDIVRFPREEVNIRQVVHRLKRAIAASAPFKYDMGINAMPFAYINVLRGADVTETVCTADSWAYSHVPTLHIAYKDRKLADRGMELADLDRELADQAQKIASKDLLISILEARMYLLKTKLGALRRCKKSRSSSIATCS